RVLGGDPPGAGALLPPRDALGEAGGAQHAGPTELDQGAALGVIEPAAGDAHLTQLVRGATVDAVTGGGGVLDAHRAGSPPCRSGVRIEDSRWSWTARSHGAVRALQVVHGA